MEKGLGHHHTPLNATFSLWQAHKPSDKKKKKNHLYPEALPSVPYHSSSPFFVCPQTGLNTAAVFLTEGSGELRATSTFL